MVSKILRGFLGVSLGFIFLYLALRRVEWNNFYGIFSRSTFCLAGATGIFILIGLFFKGLRIAWIAQGSPARLAVYTQGVVLGLGVNSFVPLRAGEAAKIFYLAKGAGIGFLRAGLLVAMERILDFFSLGILMLAAIFTNGILFHLWLERIGARSLVPVALIFWLFLLLALTVASCAIIITKNVFNLRERFKKHQQSLQNTFREILREFRDRFGASLGFSLMAWACDTAFIYSLANVFHLSMSIEKILFLQMVLSLAYVSSVSPGALGIYELLGSWTMKNMGIADDQSMAFLLTAHALTYVIMFLGAALVATRIGWSFNFKGD